MSTLESVSTVNDDELHAFTAPQYDLEIEQMESIEATLVNDAKTAYGEGVTAALIRPDHGYSNLVRSREAAKFPEVANLDPSYDLKQEMVVLIDTREGSEQVLHAATIMKLEDETREELNENERTGYYTIDSLIKLGNFTTKNFLNYYENNGIDLGKSVAVETNFKIHPKMKRYFGMGSADLFYLTLFYYLMDQGSELGSTVVFATANNLQLKSLKRTGLDVEPLMGRDNLVTEESELGVVSKPIAILINQNTHDIFGASGFRLPELYY